MTQRFSKNAGDPDDSERERLLANEVPSVQETGYRRDSFDQSELRAPVEEEDPEQQHGRPMYVGLGGGTNLQVQDRPADQQPITNNNGKCGVVCIIITFIIVAVIVIVAGIGIAVYEVAISCNSISIEAVAVYTDDARQLVNFDNALTDDCHNEIDISLEKDSVEQQETSIYVKNCSDFQSHHRLPNPSHQSPTKLRVTEPFTILDNNGISSLCYPGGVIDVTLNLSTTNDNSVSMCYFNNPEDVSEFHKNWNTAINRAVHCWREHITANTSDTYHPPPYNVSEENYYFVLLAATAEVYVQYHVELINQTYYDPSDYSDHACVLDDDRTSCVVPVSGHRTEPICVLAYASSTYSGFSMYDVKFVKGSLK